MSASRIGELLDDLQRAYDGDPWHGSSVAALLEGVSTVTAAAVPVRGGHSVWALVLHMTAWTNEVRARLEGATPGEPAEGDWPPVPEPATPAAWRDAREALRAAHRALEGAVAAMPHARLDMVVGDGRDPALGAGLTYAAMVRGLVQHHAYHGGQIALLKRMLDG
ncbi:MAG: DinB family protein [Gemmatimonadaceae bacterium]|jgi:uncharacterized damage-inducible protein DinB|nr:DinB family protein [Gemmatimonadaceae bacterium]